MKAKFLILIVIALFVTMNTEAQKKEPIIVDSATAIHIGSTHAWVETKDSIILMRKDFLGLENVSQEKKSDEDSEYGKLEELNSFSGKIIEWNYNANYICNGFLLQTEKETLLVKFNTTLGAKIKSLDENVEVSGSIAQFTENGNRVFGLVQVGDKKDTVYSSINYVFYKVLFDSANIIKDSGKISEIEYKEDGKTIKKCVLEDNILLRFSPFGKKPHPQNLKVGSTIEYTGGERYLKSGEVMKGDYKIIQCATVLIDGIEYRQLEEGIGYYMESGQGID